MPIRFRLKLMILFAATIALTLLANDVASAPPIPNTIIYLTGTEVFSQGGKQFTRFRYDVFNKDAYPAEMFAAAPALPPCGTNKKASRTWVDIYDSRGKRLFGFCNLGKPSDLNQLWFALEDTVVPPSYVYIEMTDRQTNTKYKSNLADTTE